MIGKITQNKRKHRKLMANVPPDLSECAINRVKYSKAMLSYLGDIIKW